MTIHAVKAINCYDNIAHMLINRQQFYDRVVINRNDARAMAKIRYEHLDVY
jgi:hypothetical protein